MEAMSVEQRDQQEPSHDGDPSTQSSESPSLREALCDALAATATVATAEQLRRLALSAMGVSADSEFVPVAKSGTVFDEPVRPGDLLERSAPLEGVFHSAVVISESAESAAELANRGVPVEWAGAGAYVEVIEIPFGGGSARSVGRRLTDPWGRMLRGQTLLRTTDAVSLAINSSLGENQPSPLDRQVDEVLVHIRNQAGAVSRRRRTVDPSSNFARVLASRYLSGYLSSPSSTSATAAINSISRQNTSRVVTTVCGEPDYWERATPAFNGGPIPAALRAIPGFGWLPRTFGAATDILRVANRRTLAYLDVPFLLGRRTLDTLDCSTRMARLRDPDLQANNSINESQLMHWATGVRYARLGRDRLRELFIAYELWHLELWDVFGHDPINDLIVEDAGRHMAEQIRTLHMNAGNYIDTLNRGFMDARAWVGALLRLRRDELHRQIRADTPPPARIHWTEPVPPDSRDHPFRLPSIRRMLARGTPIATVKASRLVRRYVEVYALLFEADAWERARGQNVPTTLLQRNMVNGTLNFLFRGLAEAEQARPASLILSGVLAET